MGGRKLIEYIDDTSGEETNPVVVTGDLNGNTDDAAVQLLVKANFTLMNSFQTSETQPFISHLAHTGDFLGCDFIATRYVPKFLNWSILLDAKSLQETGRLSDHIPVAARLALS